MVTCPHRGPVPRWGFFVDPTVVLQQRARTCHAGRRRCIQKHIEDRLTDAIINEEIKVGDRVSLRYDKTISEVKLVKLSLKDDIKDDVEPQNSEPTSIVP